MSEVVAVVGSRRWADTEMVREYVRSLPMDVEVVTGGGGNVDKTALHEAIKSGRRWRLHPANWRHFGKRAGMLRNITIVTGTTIDMPGTTGIRRWPMAVRVAAFWDGKSPGTKSSIAIAKSRQIPVQEFSSAPGVQLGLRLFGVVQ